MGCISSKALKNDTHRNGSGSLLDTSDYRGDTKSHHTEDTHWRLEPQKALNRFLESDCVLDKDFDYYCDVEFVELRTLLDEPLGRSHFLAHISQYKPEAADLVTLWLLLHAYHHGEALPDTRFQACKTLYKNYFYISPAQKQKANEYLKTVAKSVANVDTMDKLESHVTDLAANGLESEILHYKRLMTPASCANFNVKLIQTIFRLRPSVENALLLVKSLQANPYQSSAGRRSFSLSFDQFVDIPTPIQTLSPDSSNGSSESEMKMMSEKNRHTPEISNLNNGLQSELGISALFVDLQNEAFKEMKPLYHHFRNTPSDYEAYLKSIKQHYNRVVPDDFRYIKVLGEGAFGKVVHVIKKSTNVHYAMKIQRKDTLVSTWKGKMQHVQIERDVLVAHRSFPFIVSLRYAFQNDQYAFLCLDLAECGSLRGLLATLPGCRMQVPRVRLFVAEIVLALECLHEHGILYRDLKPENVLLGQDGHVMLADMGLAGFYYDEDEPADTSSQTFADHIARVSVAEMVADEEGIFSESSSNSTPNSNMNDKEVLQRNKYWPRIQSHSTDCGTVLYRPPEMIRHDHYNEGVDWFMLGIFTYESLCGVLPWTPKRGPNGDIAIETEEQELRMFRNKLFIPEHLGDAAIDFISGLLDLDPVRRLGVGFPDDKRDLASLKAHKFFVPLGGALATKCDWEKVLNREYKPAIVPDVCELETNHRYSHFDAMVKEWNKKEKKELKLGYERSCKKSQLQVEDLNACFSDWDYIDPSSVLEEKEREKDFRPTRRFRDIFERIMPDSMR